MEFSHLLIYLAVRGLPCRLALVAANRAYPPVVAASLVQARGFSRL